MPSGGGLPTTRTPCRDAGRLAGRTLKAPPLRPAPASWRQSEGQLGAADGGDIRGTRDDLLCFILRKFIFHALCQKPFKTATTAFLAALLCSLWAL